MKKLNTENYEVTDGSGFSGFILKISLDELIAHLGNPSTIGSVDDKVQLRWIFYEKLNDDEYCVITIYDWKQKRSINKITEWHVGRKHLANEAIRNTLDKMGLTGYIVVPEN